MRCSPWHFALALLAAVSLAGCASAPWVNQHIEAVNAEYRELEMYSYEIERENRQLKDTVQSLQDENTQLKGGTVPPRRRTGPFSAPSTNLNSTPRATPRSRPNAEPAPPAEVPEITVPDMPEAPALPPVPRLNPNPPAPNPAAPRPFPSGGAATSRPPANPVSSQKPPETTLPLLPPAPKPPRPILEDPPPAPENLNAPLNELPPPAKKLEGIEPEPVDGKVTHLFLNPIRTHGANFDSQPGDDGLTVVLEPRNQAGQFVPRAAPVSIVVLDPSKEGDAARVARWTLDEQLVRQRISRQRDNRGIQLQLPWTGGVPQTNQLKLFVRYETADGRKVEAQHDLILNPAAQASQRWTPRQGGPARPSDPAAPLVSTPPPTAPHPAATLPSATLSSANPPLPAPAVKSDLTKVIQEPPATQTDVASKEPEAAPVPGLLTPPPPRTPASPAPQRPEWKPFR